MRVCGSDLRSSPARPARCGRPQRFSRQPRNHSLKVQLSDLWLPALTSPAPPSSCLTILRSDSLSEAGTATRAASWSVPSGAAECTANPRTWVASLTSSGAAGFDDLGLQDASLSLNPSAWATTDAVATAADWLAGLVP